MKTVCFLSWAIGCCVFLSCGNGSGDKEANKDVGGRSLKEEVIAFRDDTLSTSGLLVYDSQMAGRRPAIIVVHEWWGLNDFAKEKARQLAQLGYAAFAIDMYGGKIANDPKEAGSLAMPFYDQPNTTYTRIRAAIKALSANENVDTTKLGAIGYCFGGFVVLNAAKLGAPLKGVVSFHGNLSGVQPDKEKLKASVLVCHGAADQFVSQQEVSAFRKSMDSVGADYTFIAYDSSTHAFTNPDATETGKRFKLPIAYNEKADHQSWNDMKAFFKRVFQ